METKARVIALYLPQYHPIPENDEWWGKGFTEWTNVGKALKLFKGHYQPRIPADLGYYDLRVPETRKAQADLARKFGIEGFCYWHYWFGNGKQLIERPFNEVLNSGEPDFPFCLAWANETWKGFAHGIKNRNILIEQLYPGIEDYKAHFYKILPAFKDDRYIKINGKPIFMIYKPLKFKEIDLFVKLWQDLAIQNGLNGIFFVGHSSYVSEIELIKSVGIDAVNINRIFTYPDQKRAFFLKVFDKIKRKIFKLPALVYNYKDMIKYFTGEEDKREDVFPCLVPNWDHSPRSGVEAVILQNSTPEYFECHANQILASVENKVNKIIFLKSWNEWAEGNYIEPDLKWGTKYLESLLNCLKNIEKSKYD